MRVLDWVRENWTPHETWYFRRQTGMYLMSPVSAIKTRGKSPMTFTTYNQAKEYIRERGLNAYPLFSVTRWCWYIHRTGKASTN